MPGLDIPGIVWMVGLLVLIVLGVRVFIFFVGDAATKGAQIDELEGEIEGKQAAIEKHQKDRVSSTGGAYRVFERMRKRAEDRSE